MNAVPAISSLSAWTALGWAAIHFLWEGTIVWLGAAALLRCIRRRSPEIRYVVACTTLFLCLAIFATTFFILVAANAPFPSHPIGQMRADWASDILHGFEGRNIAGIAAYCWLTGFLWMTIRYTGQWLRVWHLRNRLITPPDVQLQAVFESLKRRLRIPQAVRVLHSGIARTPMVVGCLRPVILVPISALTALTPEQLRAVIAHELAHIRRHDPWVNMAQSLVEMVLFFHPAVWWLSRQIRSEREYCCDDLSIDASESPRMLAEGLAMLESLRLNPSATALYANNRSLLTRISRMIGADSSRTVHRGGSGMGRAIAVVAAAMLVVGAFCLVQAQDHSEDAEPNLDGARTHLERAVEAREIVEEAAGERTGGRKRQIPEKETPRPSGNAVDAGPDGVETLRNDGKPLGHAEPISANHETIGNDGKPLAVPEANARGIKQSIDRNIPWEEYL